MSRNKRNRSAGKIDRLPAAMKDSVDQMILTGNSYRAIVEYLMENGVTISQMSVCNYARKFLADMQMLKVAQENFRIMAQEIGKYPHLDTTEGIIRVMSNYLFSALTSAPSEAWEGMKLESIMKEANALVRAAAYKRRCDVANEDAMNAGLDQIKEMFFSSMSRDQPELYNRIVEFIRNFKENNAADT